MPNFHDTYMATAIQMAKHSKANRLKVGAVLVTKNGVMLTGYNGTPKGSDNSCEFSSPDGSLVTKPEVIHAEENCILKAAREGISCVDSTLYVTVSPCLHCAAQLIQVGVKTVHYGQVYRSVDGIKLLGDNGVECYDYQFEYGD